MKCSECHIKMGSSRTPEVVRNIKKEFEEYVSVCPICFNIVQSSFIEEVIKLEEIDRDLPKGEIGMIMAIGIGWLMESLVLNKNEIVSIFEHIIDEGKDPWIILEKLSRSSTTNVKKNVNKARLQLEQLIK